MSKNFIRVKFIGKDGNMGFKTGKQYLINIEQDKNNNWIWVKEIFGKSGAYKSMKTLEKNWDLSKYPDKQSLF